MRLVWRLSEPSDSKIWSWDPCDSEPKITVLARARNNLAVSQSVKSHFPFPNLCGSVLVIGRFPQGWSLRRPADPLRSPPPRNIKQEISIWKKSKYTSPWSCYLFTVLKPQEEVPWINSHPSPSLTQASHYSMIPRHLHRPVLGHRALSPGAGPGLHSTDNRVRADFKPGWNDSNKTLHTTFWSLSHHHFFSQRNRYSLLRSSYARDTAN
jgi:hypothetical protein